MKLSQLAELLDAEIFSCEKNLDREIEGVCGCDLMSDVLAFAKDKVMLVTGLVNPQVIRTAEMLDIFSVVFVRGKRPTDDMIALAEECSMTLLSTEHFMYKTCGLLYEKGIGKEG